MVRRRITQGSGWKIQKRLLRATLTARKRGSEKFEARRRARTYSPAGVRDIWEVYDCACPLEIEGAVATVTLDRPEARNALTPEMLCRLADAFATYEADDTLRALIITGAGEHAFCAGGDLASTIPLLTGARAPLDDWDRRVLEDPTVMATSGLREKPGVKPIIAAVNGACMAGGFECCWGLTSVSPPITRGSRCPR